MILNGHFSLGHNRAAAARQEYALAREECDAGSALWAVLYSANAGRLAAARDRVALARELASGEG